MQMGVIIGALCYQVDNGMIVCLAQGFCAV